jgi:RNA polymerase sigma-70 factor (ECF subfamily)
LFDFERQFSPESATRIVASESRKLSAEERQRDVFETHRHRVFAVGYYMTSNEVEAEEILTGTFVSAFAKQREPDAGGVDRALLGELERRFSLEPAEAAVPDADLVLTRAATRRTDMEEALGALPPAERLVFLLKDVEGYAPAKIAGLLDRPEREVLRTLISARIRMRNALAAVQDARLAEEREREAAQAEEASAPA